MLVKLEFNSPGFAEVLKSPEVRAMVSEAAERIGAAARPMAGDEPIDVSHYTTDRAASSVTITSRRGMTLQAERGVLTRAAGSIGAEVKAK